MYPHEELIRLAVHKANLRRRIAGRRAECMAASSRVLQPVAWLDRMLALWRQLAPFAPLAALPLGFLCTRAAAPRRGMLGALLRWGPVFLAPCAVSPAPAPRPVIDPAGSGRRVWHEDPARLLSGDLGIHPASAAAQEAARRDACLAVGHPLHSAARSGGLFPVRHRPAEAPAAEAAERLFRARLATTHPAGSTDPATAALLQTLPRRDRQFLQLLSRINQLPASSAETLRILSNAEQFYPALERRIREAAHHVHLEFYIWQNDATGARFLRLLIAAAQRKVIVRLLLDGVGSPAPPADLLAEFTAAGGRFSWFQSLDPKRLRFFMNLRNHRKLQIIDGTSAFVGGMNIGEEQEGRDAALGAWRDVQVEATGSIIAELQEVFVDDWYFATGEKITAPEFFPTATAPPRLPVHIVLGGPDRRSEPINRTLVSLLNAAGARVWIATGYFVPDDIVLTALELAASRGVDVRLLVTAKSDHPWLVTVGRSFYDSLLAAGVRIFEYSAGIHHAKIAVVDDGWAMIGSANLDYRSMRLNFELNLLLHSPEHNAALDRILEDDFALCREIDPAAFARRPFRQKFAEAALRPFSPLL